MSPLDAVLRSLFVAVLHSILGMAFLGILVFVMPKFAAMFADFGAKLPVLTQLFLNLSHFVQRLAPLVVLLGLVLTLADGAIHYFLRTRVSKMVAGVWNLMVFLVLAVVTGISVWAMFLPMQRMSECIGDDKTSIHVEAPASPR